LRSDRQEEHIRRYYRTLYTTWGPQHWWPARTRLEVIVGAYLTQNTSWKNVEAALRNLRRAHVLSLGAIRERPVAEIESLVRPAGYFRQKAARLKIFVDFVDRRYAGSLSRLFAQPTAELRAQLLALNGVGPETADSILLYAGQHEVFVVDAYTRRILDRHGILAAKTDYEEVRALSERALSADTNPREPLKPALNEAKAVVQQDAASWVRAVFPSSFHAHRPSPMSRVGRSPLAQIYNDMHGLMVTAAKHYCLKSKAQCECCPLRKFLP
jgi:endonuclease III related protein